MMACYYQHTQLLLSPDVQYRLMHQYVYSNNISVIKDEVATISLNGETKLEVKVKSTRKAQAQPRPRYRCSDVT